MQAKPRLHIIAPWHVILNPDLQSTCAFGMKAYKLSAMMQPLGYECFEYSNEGSMSACINKVQMLTKEEHALFYPPLPPTRAQGEYAVIGTPGWELFDRRLRAALTLNVNNGDIICHVFGRAHLSVVDAFPQAIHVETGVGYPDKPFGAFRIFESTVWRSYLWGRDDIDKDAFGTKGNNRYYSYVIPNSWDVNEWPYCEKPEGDYVLFMSRIDPCKGLTIITDIIRANSDDAKNGKAKLLEWVFAGQGDFDKHIMQPIMQDRDSSWPLSVKHLGPVYGMERAKLTGNARCMILPTQYVEPFGGAILEGQMTGCPSVTVDYGCFTETVEHGVTGYRCNTLGDYLAAIEACRHLDRKQVSEIARNRFSLETVGKMYDRAFKELYDLNGPGWYATESHRIESTSAQ